MVSNTNVSHIHSLTSCFQVHLFLPQIPGHTGVGVAVVLNVFSGAVVRLGWIQMD